MEAQLVEEALKMGLDERQAFELIGMGLSAKRKVRPQKIFKKQCKEVQS